MKNSFLIFFGYFLLCPFFLGILPLDEGVVVFERFFLHKHLRIYDPEMLTKEV